MSVQFGKWIFNGSTPTPEALEVTRNLLAPYAPDGVFRFKDPGIEMLYLPFHTTPESHRERQPFLLRSGAVLMWDGRLDNRTDLLREFSTGLSADSPDVNIVSTVYERLGQAFLPKLIGDWALSVWDPSKQSLLLAKDFLGTRHLYYTIRDDSVVWSTVLDPLLLEAEKPVQLQEEYIAGYLGVYPAAHLTPYAGIKSVPPSSSVYVAPKKEIVTKYWDFHAHKRLHYRADGDYEEHFLNIFTTAVRRRLRCSHPVLADLSGGLDSSSIVCVAHSVMETGNADTPQLDTITYFDDLEPNWDELPFAATVEQKLGRVGTHISIGAGRMPLSIHDPSRLSVFPASRTRLTQPARQFLARVLAQGNRVHLSGIGGDEVLGGVPNPLPELADLLAEVKLRQFARQTTAWALAKRMPMTHLIRQLVTSFLPTPLLSPKRSMPRAWWLQPEFLARHRLALCGYDTRLTLSGGNPSYQVNLSTLAMLKRQIASSYHSSQPLLEKRYPLLDRDLLEFLFAIPREQLVRPGQRRSLMRRAMKAVVPDEVLNRRRKAYLARRPSLALQRDWAGIGQVVTHMTMASLGIVDSHSFASAIQAAHDGRNPDLLPIEKTLVLEDWLRHLTAQQVPYRLGGKRFAADRYGRVHEAPAVEVPT